MYVFVFQRKRDRIMGGYMKEIMPLDSNLNAVPVLLIGVASDVTDRIVPIAGYGHIRKPKKATGWLCRKVR